MSDSQATPETNRQEPRVPFRRVSPHIPAQSVTQKTLHRTVRILVLLFFGFSLYCAAVNSGVLRPGTLLAGTLPTSTLTAGTLTAGTLTNATLVSGDGHPADSQDGLHEKSVPGLTVFQALVLGFVEGATEYLPVSSTGHLLITQHLLGMTGDKSKQAAAHSLAICIQSGAILAVLVLYFERMRQILRGLIGRDADGRRLFINLIVALAPAAVLGLLFGDWIEQKLFGVLAVALALFTGGVIILMQSFGKETEHLSSGKSISELGVMSSFLVGLMQCLAFWPGFSRSLATILGCRLVGLRMTDSVEFSFLLGLVTLSAATGYKGLKDGPEMIEAYGVLMPLLSLVVAFAAAVVSVRFMVGALNRFGLAPFGYYRILLALACLLWLQN